MKSVFISSPYISPDKSLQRLMLNVLIGLIPGTLVYAWFFGPGVFINITIAIIVAWIFEAVVLQLRGKSIKPHLADCSAVVSAWLFALCLPMHSPWWLVVIGMGFAMLAGKHVYGGLGFNPFNPAMVGYVVLLISFPQEMTTWYLPDTISGQSLSLSDSIAYSLGIIDVQTWDALSAATPLDQYKTGLRQEHLVTDIRLSSPVFGNFAGVGWEWIAGAWLVGGIWLLLTRTIYWHIPTAVLIGLGSSSLLFYLIDSTSFASPIFHYFVGSIMIGAFFIATDPVTATTTNRGRIYYGLLIGILVYIIRHWGGYPDGVAFAVLLANMSVPLIDYYTQPRIYGDRE